MRHCASRRGRSPHQAKQFETFRGIVLRLAYRLSHYHRQCRAVPRSGADAGLGDPIDWRYVPASRVVAWKVFGFERSVAAQAVVAGSMADKAEARKNDSLVAVDGAPFPPGESAPGPTNNATRDAALTLTLALTAGQLIGLPI